MKIIKTPISVKTLEPMYEKLVKAVVDIEQQIMVIDPDLYVDQERVMLEELDSKQEYLWGINLRPQFFGTDDFIQFDSMINLRPWDNNPSRNVENREIQKIIRSIVVKLVVE